MTETLTRSPTQPITRVFSPEELAKLRASFEQDGYLVFRGAVPKELLSDLTAKVLETFERQKRSGAMFFGGGTMAGHLNCYPGEGSRSVYQALVDQGIIGVVEALVPKVAKVPLRPALNLNLPKSVAQNYHIDGYFDDAFVIVNIAMVDTDLVNGAIELAPGSHKRPYKYWQFAV